MEYVVRLGKISSRNCDHSRQQMGLISTHILQAFWIKASPGSYREIWMIVLLESGSLSTSTQLPFTLNIYRIINRDI